MEILQRWTQMNHDIFIANKQGMTKSTDKITTWETNSSMVRCNEAIRWENKVTNIKVSSNTTKIPVGLSAVAMAVGIPPLVPAPAP